MTVRFLAARLGKGARFGKKMPRARTWGSDYRRGL